MKKLAKLFLLSLCSWFLFLWSSNAQELMEDNSYTDKINGNTDSWLYFEAWDEKNINYNPPVFLDWDCHYQCGINLLWFFTQKFLIWIWIILWIIMVILYIKTIILCKKSDINTKNNWLIYIPILNLYPISKITIWNIRFFYFMLMIWFFIHGIYTSINKNKCCFDNPSRQEYFWVIVWICSIIMLGVLLSKLSHLIKPDNEINKESPQD